MFEDIAVLPKYPLREKGHIIIANADGTVKEGVTLQCVHCGRHWQVLPGSKRRRGWCLKCGGPTCGAVACVLCVPAEKRIELMEARSRK